MADHQPDYSQEYIMPELKVITGMIYSVVIYSVRDGLISFWLNGPPLAELNKMQTQWINALPTLIPPKKMKALNGLR